MVKGKKYPYCRNGGHLCVKMKTASGYKHYCPKCKTIVERPIWRKGKFETINRGGIE